SEAVLACVDPSSGRATTARSLTGAAAGHCRDAVPHSAEKTTLRIAPRRRGACPLGERLGVPGLQQHPSRPDEVEHETLTGFHRLDGPALDGPTHAELDVQVVGDDVPGVDDDGLTWLEVEHVDGAVAADQRLTAARRSDPEPALAAE